MKTSDELESEFESAFSLEIEKRHLVMKNLLLDIGINPENELIFKRQATEYIKRAIKIRRASEKGICPGVKVMAGKEGPFVVKKQDSSGLIQLIGRSGSFNPLSLTVIKE